MAVRMNNIENQVEILHKLSQIMLQSAEKKCDQIICRFDVDIENESVGQEFSFQIGGDKISSLLDDPEWIITDLILDLHRSIKAHTRGDWVAFTITIDKESDVKTHFEYLN